jgi:hypothetical protein
LWSLDALNLHLCAHGFELLDRRTGAVHFTPLGQGDHAKAGALAFAFANHLQVAQFKQLQRQQGTRNKTVPKGNRGKAVKDSGDGAGFSGIWVSSHEQENKRCGYRW